MPVTQKTSVTKEDLQLTTMYIRATEMNNEAELSDYYYYFCDFRSKLFVRWMNGSCMETPPQKIPGEDEMFVFSFFSDISATSSVIGMVQMIQNNMKSTLTTLTRYLTRWKKFRRVWKVDKVRDASSCTRGHCHGHQGALSIASVSLFPGRSRCETLNISSASNIACL